MGNNVHFQPRFYPADSKYVKLRNNIASDVSFITHDIMYMAFDNFGEIKYKFHLGSIQIMDNVCIGDGVKIMPDVRIGLNLIVGDGAVVTKDAFGEIRVGVSATNRFFWRII